jgi:hypothetical protein
LTPALSLQVLQLALLLLVSLQGLRVQLQQRYLLRPLLLLLLRRQKPVPPLRQPWRQQTVLRPGVQSTGPGVAVPYCPV